MPYVRVEDHVPLALPADLPPQIGVARARRAADEPVLHLGEVALEEVHLVLERGAGCVGIAALHAEVVVDLALVDGRRGLGDKLGPAHVLPVPVGRVVDGHLHALLRGGVCRVLVSRG